MNFHSNRESYLSLFADLISYFMEIFYQKAKNHLRKCSENARKMSHSIRGKMVAIIIIEI